VAIKQVREEVAWPLVNLQESNIPPDSNRDRILHQLFRYAWLDTMSYWFCQYYTIFRVHGDLPNQWRVLDECFSANTKRKVNKCYKGLNPVYYNEQVNNYG
jgi:hypothetical protein